MLMWTYMQLIFIFKKNGISYSLSVFKRFHIRALLMHLSTFSRNQLCLITVEKFKTVSTLWKLNRDCTPDLFYPTLFWCCLVNWEGAYQLQDCCSLLRSLCMKHYMYLARWSSSQQKPMCTAPRNTDDCLDPRFSGRKWLANEWNVIIYSITMTYLIQDQKSEVTSKHRECWLYNLTVL